MCISITDKPKMLRNNIKVFIYILEEQPNRRYTNNVYLNCLNKQLHNVYGKLTRVTQ